jgi:thiamine biosynthesis lipoprotein
MPKMSTDLVRYALSGPTMGTRWSALFYLPERFDVTPLEAALQAAVDEVDAQMSTFDPLSDLMRLEAAPLQAWTPVPDRLMTVLALALDIGRASDGAFDLGLGDAAKAWGFGPQAADGRLIRAALEAPRRPAHEMLELDPVAGQARKSGTIAFDLNGIAKGFGVDRLAETLRGFGIGPALAGIDGEMRAAGLRPDGRPWAIAVEAPCPGRRAPHSVLALEDAAVATSGDYRHFIEVRGGRLSHTMDPSRGAPLAASPASVTVVARTCAEADAWATALMVLGAEAGGALAERIGLDALFLLRDDAAKVRARTFGRLFSAPQAGMKE